MCRACVGAVLLLSFLLLGCAQAERLTAPTDRGTFYLIGGVARPGAYSFAGRPITVRMAVVAGGNLVEWADHAVLIRDLDRPDQRLIDLDLHKVFQQGESDLTLQDGDVLVVNSRPEAVRLDDVRDKVMTYSRDSLSSRTAPSSKPSFTRW